MKKKLLKIAYALAVTAVIVVAPLRLITCDFWDPVDNGTGQPGWVYSRYYDSYEDYVNGTPTHTPDGMPDMDNPYQQKLHGDNSSSNTTTSTNNNQNAKPVAPTLTEYDTANQPAYVVTSKKAVYDDFNKGRNEIGSVSKGTEVVATGVSSNGYYRFDYAAEDGTTTTGYLLYEGKDNIVPKEDYDAAWNETDRVEATCTEDGYIEYTNSYSGLTKKDEIKATGHVLGDEELAKEPTWTKPGEVVTHCANCNEIIETREIEPIVPMWCWYLIGGAVALCILMITVTVVIVKKRNRTTEITVE